MATSSSGLPRTQSFPAAHSHALFAERNYPLGGAAVRWIGAIVVGLSLVAVIVLAGYLGPGQEYKGEMLQEAGRVAGALFVVAVFLERALAVVTGIAFGEQIKKVEAAFAAALHDERSSHLIRLAELDAWKERVRLALGFVFALFLSAAGARTLEGLLKFDAEPPQLALLHGVDVILTAGLLAGGSNGLALIIDILSHAARKLLLDLRTPIKTVP